METRIPETLPDLKGRASIVFRVAWAFAFVLAAITVIQFVRSDHLYRQLSVESAALGINASGPDGFAQIAPRDHENANGIRPGDQLLAIDGQSFGSDREALNAMKGPDGALVELTIKSPEEESSRAILVRRDIKAVERSYANSGISFHQARDMRLAISLTLLCTWLLVASLLFLRRPNDMVAAMISFGALLMQIQISAILPTATALWFDAIPILGFGLVLLGLLLFPGGSIRPRWAWLGVPVISLAMLTLAITFAMGMRTGTLQPILVSSCMIFILAAMIVRFRRSEDEILRQQIKFVLFGIALAIVIFFPTLAWAQFEAMGRVQGGPITGIIQSLLMGIGRIAIPAGLLVALLRYRLFDADRVISRSVTYAIMTVVIGIAFFVMERLIDFIGNQIIGGGIGAASFGIAAALAAVLLNPLHAWLVRWSEIRFQSNLVHLREGLPEAAKDMRQISSMRELLDEFVWRIQPAVHACRSAIVLDDRSAASAAKGVDEDEIAKWAASSSPAPNKQGLDLQPADPLFPLRLSLKPTMGSEVGWLLLGPRIDGSFYNRDERATIAGLADPMARAIAIVAKRERREAEVNKEIDSIKAWLGRIEDALEDSSAQSTQSGPIKST